jgi:hypothetical protein
VKEKKDLNENESSDATIRMQKEEFFFFIFVVSVFFPKMFLFSIFRFIKKKTDSNNVINANNNQFSFVIFLFCVLICASLISFHYDFRLVKEKIDSSKNKSNNKITEMQKERFFFLCVCYFYSIF